MKRTIAALLLLTAARTGAEEIVVTASRTADVTAAGGTTIFRDAIAALQPVTALDLLDRVAGVRAFQKGGEGGGSYLSVRGGEPNFTLVLLDGVRVGDPTGSAGGAFDFGQLAPEALERIEVARGGLSAVHGADALSGVVNLRLRAPTAGEDFGLARVFADTRGRVGGDGAAGLGWNDGGLLLSGGAYDSGDGTKGSDLDRRQVLAKATQDIGGWTLSGLALHARTDRAVFPEDSGGPRLAVVRQRERGNARLSLGSVEATGPAGSFRPHVVLSRSRQDARSDSPGIAPGVLDGVPPILAYTRFDRFEATGDMTWTLVPRLAVAAGASYRDEDGRSRGIVDVGVPLPADFDIARHLASGFAEATYETAGAMATVGVRYDDPSGRRGEWTGRASGRVPVGPLALTAGWSEGYKLPSLYALAYPLIANPALKPERSTNVEAGVERMWTGGKFGLRYFRSRFTDLIDFDPALFTNVNRARVVTEGIEAEGRVEAGDLSAEGSLTYLHIESPTPLRSRPSWQGAARVAWRASAKLTLDAAARFNSSFLDSSVPTGSIRSDGHVEADLGARYRVRQFTVSLVARNVFGADYENAVGFPGEGRTLRASVAASF